MTIHFIAATLGFLGTAPVVFWLLAAIWHAFGCWPLRNAPASPGGHLRGGMAKHDWKGYAA